jgi:hypothetical protein
MSALTLLVTFFKNRVDSFQVGANNLIFALFFPLVGSVINALTRWITDKKSEKLGTNYPWD